MLVVVVVVVYCDYVRKIGLITNIGVIKRNQGRVLSISVEQKYRALLHRRCGGVCVRDGCESNDGASFTRDKSNRFVHKEAYRESAAEEYLVPLRNARVNARVVVGGKRCLRLERDDAASSSERCCDVNYSRARAPKERQNTREFFF